MNNHFNWIENALLQKKVENEIGTVSTEYMKPPQIKLLYHLKFIKDRFDPSEWKDVLELRDKSYNFLNSNLYFRKK